ncbi:MAG: DUF1778 domain-containing protein, partial [Aestuariivirga sp.]
DNVCTFIILVALKKVMPTMTAAATQRPAHRPRRDVTINLRLPAQTRDLLDAAAQAVGKNRTQFVVDSARAQAIDVLLDKRIFNLDEASFDAFAAALDNPPAPSQKLKELMARKAPWEM